MSLRRLRTLRVLAIGAALSGVFLWLGARHYFSGHPLIAARVPVDLRDGRSSRATFQTHFDSVYDLDLGVARAMPLLQLKCLLGIERQHWEKCETRSRLDVKWEIDQGKKRVASGRVTGEQDPTQWDGLSVRNLGWFRAQKGESYQLLITNVRDASLGLSAARPQVVVRTVPSALPNGSYAHWVFFSRAAKWLAASGLLLLSLLLLANRIRSP